MKGLCSKKFNYVKRRIMAFVLVYAMICSMLFVPAKVQAATDVELEIGVIPAIAIEDAENNSSNADITISNTSQYNSLKELQAAGYKELEVTLTLGSYTAWDGKDPGIMPYVSSESIGWSNGDVWKNVNGAGTYVVKLPLSAVSTSDNSKIARFGVQIANITGAVSISDVSAKLVAGSSAVGGDDSSGDFGVERDYASGVTAALTNQDAPSNDWSSFDMSLTNSTSNSICDWIVVLEVPTGMAAAFKCWNATFVADGDTIYLYPMQSGANAVIGANSALSNNVPGGGFAGKYVDASSITVKKVYFNQGSSSNIDYSSGNTNDESGGNGGAGNSSSVDTSTNKELDVEYNYAKLLQESLYFYDANMCGTIEDVCGLSWRGNCHTYDANVSVQIDGKTYKVDASGGFHDAGDHPKFGLPQGYAASVLGMSYYEFGDAFDKTGQTAHLKKITNHFCDYFKRCMIYDDSNTLVGFVCQVGDGNKDHAEWSAPETQTMDRPVIVATASNPSTDQVSVAAAALALNYVNFGDASDLKAAKDLFAFAKKNEKNVGHDGANGQFYRSDSYKDDYGFAAAALYIATGKQNAEYLSEYKNGGYVNSGWVLDWANTGVLGCMLMGESQSVSGVVSALRKSSEATLDGVFSVLNKWGSCRYNAAGQFVGLSYDKMTGTKTYDDWAVSQMNYMIGDNPNKRCYAVGYNENSSKYPHHRAASASSNASQYSDNKHTLLGALVGGPDPSGTYKDLQDDYVLNEVALDYNAGYVAALAGLVSNHYGEKTTKLSYGKTTSDNVSWNLASETELKALGVTKFYGTSGEDSSTETSEEKTTATTEEKSTETSEEKTTATTEEKSTETSEEKTTATTEEKSTETSEEKTTATTEDKSTETSEEKTTATTENTSSEATTETPTTEEKPVAVEKITVSENEVSLKTGDSTIVEVTVEPENATNKLVKVGVTDETVASATLTDHTITVSAKKEGVTSVTVSSVENGSISTSFNVTVSENVQAVPSVSYKVIKQTKDSISVVAESSSENLELSIDKTNWIAGKECEFTGLKSGTYYKIYARCAATDTQMASAVSKDVCDTFTVFSPSDYTATSGALMIDVSKITSEDCDYIKMFSQEITEGVAKPLITVTKENGNMVLCPIDKPVIITGSNDKIVIRTDKGSDITLSDAKVGFVNVIGDTSLKVSGKNDISNGISVSKEAVLKIDKSEPDKQAVLSVTNQDGNAISGEGSLVVQDGTLSVNAPNGAGIMVSHVELNGGEVIVNSSDSALKADEIMIDGSKVSLSVTGKDVPVLYAKDTISLESGSIATNRPSDSVATDVAVSETGSITQNSKMEVVGTVNYSKNPVDENGQEIIPEGTPVLLKKGERFESDGFVLQVSKVGTLDNSVPGKVTIVESALKDTDIVIPDTVTYKEVIYSVTKLSATAFKGNAYIKTVTIGKYIESIPGSAFSGCQKLKKVTFNGAVKSIGINAFKNTSSKLKVIGPKKTGYTYRWYLKSNKSKEVKQIGVSKDGRKSLIGKWTKNTYKVKYHANGGKGKMSGSKTYKYGTSYKLSKNNFTRKGYKFTGWNTKKNGKGKSFKDKAKFKNLSSQNGKTVTLYAQWKKIN